MDASIVDLRYNMREVPKALSRRENVRILYRGKVKGEIVPTEGNRTVKSRHHALFGMRESDAPQHAAGNYPLSNYPVVAFCILPDFSRPLQ